MDERIRSGPPSVSFSPPITDAAANRTVLYEFTDQLCVDSMRPYYGLRASVPILVILLILCAALEVWAFKLGDGAVTLAQGVVIFFILVAAAVVRNSSQSIKRQVANLRRMPHQWYQITFVDECVLAENALFRSRLPWNVLDSIIRFEHYWQMTALGSMYAIPSAEIGPDLASYIESQAAANRVPFKYETSFQRRLERESGRKFVEKPAALPNGWILVFALIFLLMLLGSLLVPKTREPANPRDAMPKQHG